MVRRRLWRRLRAKIHARFAKPPGTARMLFSMFKGLSQMTRHTSLKRPFVLATIGAFALAACDTAPAGPRTTDSQGRAVVSASEAANLFMSACYRPGNSEAGVRRATAGGNFKASTDSDDILLTSHTTKALSVSLLSPGICFVSFDAGVSSLEAAKQAAAVMIPLVKPTAIGGKKGRGALRFTTAKGTVTVTNNATVKVSGATISLVKR